MCCALVGDAHYNGFVCQKLRPTAAALVMNKTGYLVSSLNSTQYCLQLMVFSPSQQLLPLTVLSSTS